MSATPLTTSTTALLLHLLPLLHAPLAAAKPVPDIIIIETSPPSINYTRFNYQDFNLTKEPPMPPIDLTDLIPPGLFNLTAGLPFTPFCPTDDGIVPECCFGGEDGGQAACQRQIGDACTPPNPGGPENNKGWPAYRFFCNNVVSKVTNRKVSDTCPADCCDVITGQPKPCSSVSVLDDLLDDLLVEPAALEPAALEPAALEPVNLQPANT